METDSFGDWIIKQLEDRGWTQAELARRAALGEGTLSRIISNLRRAGPDAALAIARALQEPPEKVFRLAGLLPDLNYPEDQLPFRKLYDIMRRLNRHERKQVLDYALWRYRAQATAEERETYDTDTTTPPHSETDTAQ